MIEIQTLPSNRWKEFRDLRLEALQTDPTAFSSSYEEEKRIPPDEWKLRIGNTLFASSDNVPIGMIVYIIDDKLKTKHIANIYGVYVKKKYRNRGIGKKLVKAVLKIIQDNSNVSKIRLTVNPQQTAAAKLYQQFMFKETGRLIKELYVNDKFHDELILEKHV